MRNYLYDSRRWRKISQQQLCEHPLCVMCLASAEVVPATIADHVVPHAGDLNTFWLGPLQSLCASHHNGSKRRIENRGYHNEIGLDGWPTDPNHPVNKIKL